jgi:hypothetical protein
MNKKAKEILKVVGVSLATLGVFGAAFAGINHLAFNNAFDSPTPFDAVEAQAVSPTTLATTELFVPPSITIVPFHFDEEAPANAMPMEEAAHVGAQYIWDAFGKSIDGMYVIMTYMDCRLRQGQWRWQGTVALPDEMPENTATFEPQGVWEWGEIVFSFAIDSVTGERIDISYFTPRGNHPPRIIDFDTQALWETPRGQEIRAMDNDQLAEFAGLSQEQLNAFKQEALELAQAHFINSADVNIKPGTFVDTPTGRIYLPSVNVWLDTDEDGEIIGTFENIQFIATDENGNQAVVVISEWLGFRTMGVFTT